MPIIKILNTSTGKKLLLDTGIFFIELFITIITRAGQQPVRRQYQKQIRFTAWGTASEEIIAVRCTSQHRDSKSYDLVTLLQQLEISAIQLQFHPATGASAHSNFVIPI